MENGITTDHVLLEALGLWRCSILGGIKHHIVWVSCRKSS